MVYGTNHFVSRKNCLILKSLYDVVIHETFSEVTSGSKAKRTEKKNFNFLCSHPFPSRAPERFTPPAVVPTRSAWRGSVRTHGPSWRPLSALIRLRLRSRTAPRRRARSNLSRPHPLQGRSIPRENFRGTGRLSPAWGWFRRLWR